MWKNITTKRFVIAIVLTLIMRIYLGLTVGDIPFILQWTTTCLFLGGFMFLLSFNDD